MGNKVPKITECPTCAADVTLWCDPLVETVGAVEIIAGTCEHIDELNEAMSRSLLNLRRK